MCVCVFVVVGGQQGNADWNITQVPPPWHSWLNHIRQTPPHLDAVVKESTPEWEVRWRESLTGTRGAFRTYGTSGEKVRSWEGEVRERG